MLRTNGSSRIHDFRAHDASMALRGFFGARTTCSTSSSSLHLTPHEQHSMNDSAGFDQLSKIRNLGFERVHIRLASCQTTKYAGIIDGIDKADSV